MLPSDGPWLAGTNQHQQVAQSNLNFLLLPEGKTHTPPSVSRQSGLERAWISELQPVGKVPGGSQAGASRDGGEGGRAGCP